MTAVPLPGQSRARWLRLALGAGLTTLCAIVMAGAWIALTSDTGQAPTLAIPAASAQRATQPIGGLAELWGEQPAATPSAEIQPRGGLAETWEQQEGEEAPAPYPHSPNDEPGPY